MKKARLLLSFLLIFASLFTSACFFDPDEAVNIGDSVTKKITVQDDSTLFEFYYDPAAEHPIEDYGMIRVTIEYYRDYHSTKKNKDFFFEVPDDISLGEGPSFTAEIDDVLGEESVVYVYVLANYKTESGTGSPSRFWLYVLAVVIAVVLLILLWSAYMALCDSHGSNTPLPSFMWLCGMGLYLVVAFVISIKWGNGPAGFVLGGAILYFICTLFTYFTNRE